MDRHHRRMSRISQDLDDANGILDRMSAIYHVVAGNSRGSGTLVGPSKYTNAFQDYRGH